MRDALRPMEPEMDPDGDLARWLCELRMVGEAVSLALMVAVAVAGMVSMPGAGKVEVVGERRMESML